MLTWLCVGLAEFSRIQCIIGLELVVSDGKCFFRSNSQNNVRSGRGGRREEREEAVREGGKEGERG